MDALSLMTGVPCFFDPGLITWVFLYAQSGESTYNILKESQGHKLFGDNKKKIGEHGVHEDAFIDAPMASARI